MKNIRFLLVGLILFGLDLVVILSLIFDKNALYMFLTNPMEVVPAMILSFILGVVNLYWYKVELK